MMRKRGGERERESGEEGKREEGRGQIDVLVWFIVRFFDSINLEFLMHSNHVYIQNQHISCMNDSRFKYIKNDLDMF